MLHVIRLMDRRLAGNPPRFALPLFLASAGLLLAGGWLLWLQ